MNEEEAKLAKKLEEITEELCPLDKALMLANALREVYKREFEIEMYANGSFTVRQINGR